jgi:2-hydroxychromene-2-carboxylate isomerase
MPSLVPKLFYDLGSPYAYLTMERAASVLGIQPQLEPVLVGGIFVLREHGSWSQTADRAGRMAEVEARAERYGLAPLRWPPEWPNNTLKAMRAVIWAEQDGAGERFARAAFRRAFAEARDLSDIEVLVEIADSVGLAGTELGEAIEQPAIKDALREATNRAWEEGVVGVPCIGVGEKLFYGDDQLEFAAEKLSAVT